ISELRAYARVRCAVEREPVSRNVVHRFVPGARTEDAVRASGGLAGRHRMSTIDYLGEDTTELRHAQHTPDRFLALIAALADAGLTTDGTAEASLKLSALGQALPG